MTDRLINLPASSLPDPHAEPCHAWPYQFNACAGCPEATPMPCATPCHGWPYDAAYCSTCTASRLRSYQILDTVEIRPTHPVAPIRGATATVVATTPFSALVQFHNRAHGMLYGSLDNFLEIENLHLEHLEIPESSRLCIDYPLQEEPQS